MKVVERIKRPDVALISEPDHNIDVSGSLSGSRGRSPEADASRGELIGARVCQENTPRTSRTWADVA
jgi:hypothetical protein